MTNYENKIHLALRALGNKTTVGKKSRKTTGSDKSVQLGILHKNLCICSKTSTKEKLLEGS